MNAPEYATRLSGSFFRALIYCRVFPCWITRRCRCCIAVTPVVMPHQAARRQLERVGLAERLHYRPADLSGGQRQRVAIARALTGEPSLLLADKPTGNLDSQTAGDILSLLLTLNREQGVMLVMVTHDESIARQMQRRIQVNDGRVQEYSNS